MPWIITAPTGSFATVAKAADAEGQLDWNGLPGADHDASTLAYAAVECAQWLGKVRGVRATLRLWKGSVPVGPSVTILSPRFLPAGKPALEKVFGRVRVPPTDQSFFIRTTGSRSAPRYLILGGGAIGALYGTYELLNRLGFRWLGPDEWDTVVPTALPHPLPGIRTEQSPSFTVRGYWIMTRRGDRSMVQWMARNRLNLWSLADPDKPFCRKLGMKFSGGNHGDFARFVPPEQFFAAHPEWYALRRGRRSRNVKAWAGDNLCLSNPGARAQFVGAMVEDLIHGEAQWADLMSIVPSDGGHWCECRSCQAAGTPTDRLMLLIHDCAQAVRRARAENRLHREVTIGAIAYLETKDPPTHPLPRGFDPSGMMVTFFPIERCYAHAFADRACSDINGELRRLYEAWTRGPRRVFLGQVGIGEYYNVSKFVGLSIPFTKTMARDIPYFHRTGARMMHYMHPVVRDWGTLSLTNTQYAAQLWNHRLDCRRWLHGFFADRYGPNAGEMAAFYDLLERAMANSQALKHNPNLGNGKDHLFHTLKIKGNPRKPVNYSRSRHFQYEARPGSDNNGPSMVQTIALIDQAQRVLDRALLYCRDPLIRRRLAADSRRFQYTRNMMYFYYRMIRVRLLENQGDAAAAALEAQFLRDMGETLRREEQMPRQGCQDHPLLFQNGLMATYLSGPYKQIMAEYGLKVPPIPFDGVV